MASSTWSDLPSDLLGLVIARLPFPADRARLRSVCRAWHSAVRLHVAAAPQLPWIVLSDGNFVTVSNDGGLHHMTFPNSNTTFVVGSTDGWLALHRTDVDATGTKTHKFFLHNPFTGATSPRWRQSSTTTVIVRSSGPDGGGHLIAVMTNSWKCPIILCLPGKGAWTPEQLTMPFIRVIDIVFFGDKLYLITETNDLFAVEIVDDEVGRPTVTNIERIIKHPRNTDNNSNVDARFRWSDTEEEDDDNVIDDEELDNDGDDYYDEASSEDSDSESEDDDVDAIDNDAAGSSSNSDMESAGYSDDDEQLNVVYDEELDWSCSKYEILEDYDSRITTWNLLEASGKLLMVRREWIVAAFTPTGHTRSVDADMDAGKWIPVTGGLGGQAIFLSQVFSKSVHAPAHGEVEEDVIPT
uniref:F-box domain-containing protein n=1 Tax=Leersia perrieri TaxID=77586 RepID=A0A0D9WZ42_9ORYZ